MRVGTRGRIGPTAGPTAPEDSASPAKVVDCRTAAMDPVHQPSGSAMVPLVRAFYLPCACRVSTLLPHVRNLVPKMVKSHGDRMPDEKRDPEHIVECSPYLPCVAISLYFSQRDLEAQRVQSVSALPVTLGVHCGKLCPCYRTVVTAYPCCTVSSQFFI